MNINQNLSDLKAGDKVLIEYTGGRGPQQPEWRSVSKVGRKYLTIKDGNRDVRFVIETGQAAPDGGWRNHRLWRDQKTYDDQKLYAELRQKVDKQLRDMTWKTGLTLEQVAFLNGALASVESNDTRMMHRIGMDILKNFCKILFPNLSLIAWQDAGNYDDWLKLNAKTQPVHESELINQSNINPKQDA